MRVLDVFSGIGGFSLGLERAGMTTVAFCEIEPYCRAILKKHWPGVPCYDDIGTLSRDRLARDGIIADVAHPKGKQDRWLQQPKLQTDTRAKRIDVICGGFPCQDISTAGKGAGIEGARSGLWSEYARLIGEIRPRCAIVENVAALLGRGLGRVLGDLAALGYDAEWHCIPASAVGAPHRRDRIWIVAYSHGKRSGTWGAKYAGQQRKFASHCSSVPVADTPQHDVQGKLARFIAQEIRRRQEQRQAGSCCDGAEWWATEPDVGRVAHGIPARVDRLKAIGNAVVPQIPEIIGKAIMEAYNGNPHLH